MKTRSDDRLSNLLEEDRLKLDAWLERESYRRIVDLAAAPRPEGLALTINIRALSRYYHKHIAKTIADELTELALHHPEAAQKAATALIQSKALQAAAQPGFSLTVFNSLSRYQNQVGNQRLREKHLALQRAKQS